MKNTVALLFFTCGFTFTYSTLISIYAVLRSMVFFFSYKPHFKDLREMISIAAGILLLRLRLRRAVRFTPITIYNRRRTPCTHRKKNRISGLQCWPPCSEKEKSTLSSIHQSLEESAETESVARSHILRMSFIL